MHLEHRPSGLITLCQFQRLHRDDYELRLREDKGLEGFVLYLNALPDRFS
jgi:hypothetical protein